jgi:hypothetical protein
LERPCLNLLSPNRRILHPSKLSFKTESTIKTLPDKQKLREFNVISPTLRKYSFREFIRLKTSELR